MNIFLLLLFLFTACGKKEEAKPNLPVVRVTKPLIRDIDITLEYVGHVEAFLSVNITSQIAGKIVATPFIEGTPVKTGDTLFIIDPRPYQSALAKAEATLSENIAKLKYSQDTVTRFSKLVKEDLVSKQDYDQYTSDELQNEALITQSKADIDVAALNLSYCTIASTMDGVVGIRQQDVGNYVAVGADTLTTINQITPIYVTIFVAEEHLPKIRSRQAIAPLKVIAKLQEHRYEGALTIIDNQVDLDTGTVRMLATFPNQDKSLWPGSYVTANLVLETKKDGLLLPVEAVTLGQKGSYVYVLKEDQTVELRAVTPGQIEGDKVLITTGILPNETVITEGQLNLYPGVAVEVVQ